jgi:tRNA pseudouridine38-40 synthase
MRRYRIDLSYDGSAFFGFQVQPNQASVQASIELVLCRLNKDRKVKLVGCGRTDTGVHAKHFVAHFEVHWEEDLEKIRFKLNKMLPNTIAIHHLSTCPDDFHARFSAKKRSYQYYIHQEKNPFKTGYSYHFPYPLNLEKMNQAAQFLIGKHDFSSFSKTRTQVSNNFCEVHEAFWKKENEQYVFTIGANRFLRNMVRAIVGTLLLVGEEKIDPQDLLKIIAAKNRQEAAFSVPPQGLFLWKVHY